MDVIQSKRYQLPNIPDYPNTKMSNIGSWDKYFSFSREVRINAYFQLWILILLEQLIYFESLEELFCGTKTPMYMIILPQNKLILIL